MIVIRLVELLNEIPMSQHKLSRLTVITQSSINDMYQNKTIQLSLDNLVRICKTLDCDITDVIELKRTNDWFLFSFRFHLSHSLILLLLN